MDDPSLALPSVADRYDALESLGEDALFRSFRARDRAENRIVRLRLLRPDIAESSELVELLRADLASVFAFQSPVVVRLLDMGDADPPFRLYVVEEYYRGIDFSERIRRSAGLEWGTALESLVPVVEALIYAHDRGVSHGDVRSWRVTTGATGRAVLGGFGEYRALEMAIRLRGGRSSPPATPPECRAGTAPGHPLQDIWLVGALLYEMLCGEPPVTEGKAISGGGQLVPSVDPRTVRPRLPEALAGVVVKCLAERPDERYATARALLSDLEEIRRAIRDGDSLDWSPAQRPNPGSVSMAGQRSVSSGERPRIAPESVAREETMASKSKGEGGDGGKRSAAWLTVAMVVSGLLLVGSVALVFSWVRPFLVPASVVLVPNLVGLSESEAMALARERGFELQVVDRQYREDPPADRIYQMREKVGTPIRPGQPVAVWVSKGPEMVEVPDVARMGLDKARQVLESAGLKVGVVSRVWDFTEPVGNVVDQAGMSGQRRPRGSAIDITVSKGPEPDPLAQPEPTPSAAAKPPAPDQGKSTEPVVEPAPGERVYSVPYTVPSDGRSHRIRVDVEDDEGLHTAYDQTHEAGEALKIEVTGVGAKVQIRLYDNDILKGTAP